MLVEDIFFVNDAFESPLVTKAEFDLLLEGGWRNHGKMFFRYNLAILANEIRFVVPLRIRLGDFKFSKSQRRIIAQNQDLTATIAPIEIDDEKEELFERHKKRFDDNIPESIYSFLDTDAANIPAESFEVSIRNDEGRLVASSFFSIGEESTSGIYAMFEPEESSRSLGILTMLLEIENSIKLGKSFYYQGYIYAGDSFYDYKKRFSALEQYNWQGNWSAFIDDTSGDLRVTLPIP